MHNLVVSSGEPAGIGPELCLRLAERDWPARLVVVGDQQCLADRARQLGIDCTLLDASRHPGPAPRGELLVQHVPLAAPCVPGVPDAANARSVLQILDYCVDACRSGNAAAMITAPLHKGVINDAGVPFSGHTEYLAKRCQAQSPVMLLCAGGLRVALATTHLSLREVPNAITADALEATLTVLRHDLQARFGLKAPMISVLGLNPHAGESGHLGREELEIIAPLLDRLRGAGWLLRGPLPADTAFTPRALEGVDAVLAMYHDQGLPVLKYAGFGAAVNVTLGLPIVRTSVDHGTALDLAASGGAEPGSLFLAVEVALQMLDRSAQ